MKHYMVQTTDTVYFRYQDFSLPGIFAPWSKSSTAPRNESSRELSRWGMNVPGNFRSWEQKFRSQWELSLQGVKIPGSEKSLNHISKSVIFFMRL